LKKIKATLRSVTTKIFNFPTQQQTNAIQIAEEIIKAI
jgi:hypothetical protein